jgi:hypothetical protein
MSNLFNNIIWIDPVDETKGKIHNIENHKVI